MKKKNMILYNIVMYCSADMKLYFIYSNNDKIRNDNLTQSTCSRS